MSPFKRVRVKKMLLAAADHIEKVGWHQGSYFNWSPRVKDTDVDAYKDMPCCAIGSFMALNECRRDLDCEVAVERYLGHVGLSSFNDTPGRTKEEVLAALRGAAEAL